MGLENKKLELIKKKKSLIKIIGIIWMLPIFVPLFIDDIFTYFTILFLPIVLFYNLNHNFKIDVNLKFWIGYIIFSFISAIFLNSYNEFTLKYLTFYIQGILVYYIITSIYNYTDFEWLIKWVVIFCVISFLVAFTQNFFGLTDVYLVNEDGMGLISEYSRVVPRGFDPNYYYLHLLLPFCFSLVKFRDSKILLHKCFYLFLLILFAYATIGISSKSALLIMIILIVLTFIKKVKTTIYLIILPLVILFLLPTLAQIFPYSFIRYNSLFDALSLSNYQTASTSRTIVWAKSFVQFLDNPVLGVGIGQVVAENSKDYFLSSRGLLTTHNSIIHTLAESGLIGFIFLFTPLFRILKRSFKINNDILKYTIIGSCIMILTIDAVYYKVFLFNLGLLAVFLKNKYV